MRRTWRERFLPVGATLMIALISCGCAPPAFDVPDPPDRRPDGHLRETDPPPPPGHDDFANRTFPSPLPIEDAEAILLRTKIFVRNNLSPQVIAFNALMDQPDGRARFAVLGGRAQWAGRLYALAALRAFDAPEAASLAERLRSIEDKILAANSDVWDTSPVKALAVAVETGRLWEELRALAVFRDWNEADLKTPRLAPAAFVDVPAAVRDELTRRGCTIPQPHGASRPANVVSGRFTTATGVDWAALCSRDRVSTILVFRDGSASRVSEFGRQPDRDSLMSLGPGIGFIRRLNVADDLFIRSHHSDSEPPLPSPLDHEGVLDLFSRAGPRVWYRSGGRWRLVTTPAANRPNHQISKSPDHQIQEK